MKKIYLSVVIPCFNESENLKRGVLDEVNSFLKIKKYAWEVIVSDDGSTDQSLQIVGNFVKKNPDFRLLENTHAGKPFAVRAGIESAKGEIVLFTDMDQSTPIDQVDKLLPWLEKGYPVVIGSRGTSRKNFPFYRVLASNVFRILRGAFILPEIIDTQCGFKAFENEVAKKVFSMMEIFKRKEVSKGWRVTAFDVEALFIAKKLGCKIKEVEVTWKDRDIAKGKQRSFMKESREMAKEILRVRLNDWQRIYG